MRRILAFGLLTCLLLTLCACGPTNQNDPSFSENPTEPTEELVVPKVKLVINLDKEDTETDLRVFPANRLANQDNARFHIYVESEKETEQIRVKLERKYGENDLVTGDFVVKADAIYDIPANEWYTMRTGITAADVYFYRITLYYGEHEILLDSRTIYVPYANPQYSETDFDDTPPAFRPLNELTEEEQAVYDKCRFAVKEYAASGYYLKVNSATAWKGSTGIYLCVEFQVTDGEEIVWFAIDSDNPENYFTEASTKGIVPTGEGTDDQLMLDDFYYLAKALTAAVLER